MGFYTSQALIGYGCFQSYLFEKKLFFTMFVYLLQWAGPQEEAESGWQDVTSGGHIPDILLGPKKVQMPTNMGAVMKLLDTEEHHGRAFDQMVEDYYGVLGAEATTGKAPEHIGA